MEEQVRSALERGYAITPRASGPQQDPRYLKVIRGLAVEAVYIVWNRKHRPASLWEIYSLVMAKVQDKIPTAERLPWRAGVWKIPSKRTVDRRVNEAADPRFYKKLTPIIAVGPGFYMPNPQTFDGRTRIELEALLKR